MIVFKKMKTLLVLICLIACFSCKDSDKEVATDSNSKSYSNKFDNPKWVEKYSEYVSFYNEINQSLVVPMDRYNNDIPESGPKAGLSIGLITIDDYPSEELVEAQAIAIEIPELDAAAITVNDEFNKLIQVLDDAHVYYERKDFEEDKYAKGKKYHELVMSHSEALYTKIETLVSKIESLEKNLHVFELERYKNEGLMMRYHMAKLVEHGEDAYAFAAVEDMETYAKTDSIAVDRVIQDLIKTIDEANKLGKDKERFAKEFANLGAEIYYEEVIEEGNIMISNLRGLKKNIRKQDFTNHSRLNYNDGDGLPNSIIVNYERIVNKYNNLIR